MDSIFSGTKILQNEHSMQQKVETYIQKHQLLTHQKPVIVGVSGGTDSVALLHILVSLGYDCIIAHCNFHLRTDESNRDEDFVRNLSKAMKLPYYHIDFETVEYSEKHGISIEMAARDLRYNWFYKLLDTLQAQAIAVAHHADDSIETMLMNLVRGTGLRGLTGIPARNKKVVRPLLCTTRLELEAYLIQHDLEHVEDSTNASVDYQRNKFRNEVLPLLEEINPAVRHTLYNTLGHIEGSLTVYQEAIDKIKQKITQKENDSIKIDIDLLKKQAHIPTVLFELLHPCGFGTAIIEQIAEQLSGESGKTFYSDTYRLLKDRKYLILSKREENPISSYWISVNDKKIDQPFSLEINRIAIKNDFQVSKNKNCIHINASKLTFPLEIRRWREGDVFYPFGMKQRKKVSDFFIDNKLSLLEKEKSWLLVSGENIVWIVGQRMDDRFRIDEETKEVIELILS